jgi:hypothetical protein
MHPMVVNFLENLDAHEPKPAALKLCVWHSHQKVFKQSLSTTRVIKNLCDEQSLRLLFVRKKELLTMLSTPLLQVNSSIAHKRAMVQPYILTVFDKNCE